jgi:hypothetical protein
MDLSSSTLSGYFERLRRAARSPSRRLSHFAAPGEDLFYGENGEPRGAAFSQQADRNHIDICSLEQDILGLLSRTLIEGNVGILRGRRQAGREASGTPSNNVPKF